MEPESLKPEEESSFHTHIQKKVITIWCPKKMGGSGECYVLTCYHCWLDQWNLGVDEED